MPGADVSACPYVLIGSPERMKDVLAERKTRLGLSAIIVKDRPDMDRIIDRLL